MYRRLAIDSCARINPPPFPPHHNDVGWDGSRIPARRTADWKDVIFRLSCALWFTFLDRQPAIQLASIPQTEEEPFPPPPNLRAPDLSQVFVPHHQTFYHQ
jgi:hypothetical protein